MKWLFRKTLVPLLSILLLLGSFSTRPIEAKTVQVQVPVHVHIYCPAKEPTKFQLELQMQVLKNLFITSPFRFKLESVDHDNTIIGGHNELNVNIIDIPRVHFMQFPLMLALGYTSVFWNNDDPDQVTVDCETLPQGRAYPYNGGFTLPHEVGHWLGIFHETGTCRDYPEPRCNVMDNDLEDAFADAFFTRRQVKEMIKVGKEKRQLGT